MFLYTQEVFIIVLIIQFICKKATLQLRNSVSFPFLKSVKFSVHVKNLEGLDVRSSFIIPSAERAC
jgi:hypothetical protein